MQWFTIENYKFLVGYDDLNVTTRNIVYSSNKIRVYAVTNHDGTKAIGWRVPPVDMPAFENMNALEAYCRGVQKGETMIGWMGMCQRLAQEDGLQAFGWVDEEMMLDYKKVLGEANKPGCCCHDCVHYTPAEKIEHRGLWSSHGRCSEYEKTADASQIVFICAGFKPRKP